MGGPSSGTTMMYYRQLPALFAGVLVFFVTRVFSSGCQNDCDCAFDWVNNDLPDNDVTLRYEVMSGLVGGFAPLVIGGLSLLTYKLCTRNAAKDGIPKTPSGSSPHPFAGGPWRTNRPGSGQSSSVSPPAYDLPRVSSPISLYGETDSEFLNGGSVSQTGGHTSGISGGGPSELHSDVRPGTVNSRFTNIHRNVKSDLVNQWFKNVNLKKY